MKIEDIQLFASYWRELSPAAISIGVAPERNRNGGSGLRAAFALPALTGNFGRPGAGVCDVSGYFPVNNDQLTRPDLLTGEVREFNTLDVADHILNPGDELPLKGVFIYNHNPLAVTPQQVKLQAALQQEDLFVVGSDISMTDSMACADVILPATTHLEYGDIYKAYGHHYLQRTEAVIPPQGEAVTNMELFRRLGTTVRLYRPLFLGFRPGPDGPGHRRRGTGPGDRTCSRNSHQSRAGHVGWQPWRPVTRRRAHDPQRANRALQ